MTDCFVVARNPDAESTLPYLLRPPIDGGDRAEGALGLAEDYTHRFLAAAAAQHR